MYIYMAKTKVFRKKTLKKSTRKSMTSKKRSSHKQHSKHKTKKNRSTGGTPGPGRDVTIESLAKPFVNFYKAVKHGYNSIRPTDTKIKH